MSKAGMRQLTGKQKAFADAVLAEPTKPKSQIVKELYNVTTDGSARQLASENMTNRNIMLYLDKHAEQAQSVLVDAMKASKAVFEKDEDGRWEKAGDEPDHAIRLRAADSLLDRVYGKATQRVESVNTNLELRIDLFSDE